MMNKTTSILLSLISIFCLSFFAMQTPQAVAVETVFDGVNSAKGVDQPESLFGDEGIFQLVSNTLLFFVGVLSVIMLIIGGLRYVVSGGKKEAVTNAKNTILYAIIGLIVSLLAYAIIRFVIDSFAGGGSNFSSGTNI